MRAGSALPSWLSFDPATMTVSGIAPAAFDQTLKLVVSDDNGGETSAEFALTIASPLPPNQAPEIVGGFSDQSGTVGQPLSFLIPSSIFSDPDGDALTYRASLTGGQALPAWLSFNSSTGLFSGTPPADLAGQSLAIKIWASDGRAESDGLIFNIDFDPPVDSSRIVGSDGDDVIRGAAGQDEISGLAGNDTLYGEDGHDILDGGLGHDHLYGGAGNDILKGGRGNDVLEGGSGSDIYVFNKGDGNDIIINDDSDPGSHDELRLGEGLNKDELFFQRGKNNNDLIIGFDSAPNDTVTLRDYFDGNGLGKSSAIESIKFADGSVLTRAELDKMIEFRVAQDSYGIFIRGGDNDDNYPLGGTAGFYVSGGGGDDRISAGEGNDRLKGGAGNDVIYGNGGNDILEGDAGNDILDGGADSDIYIFLKGDGSDIIINKTAAPPATTSCAWARASASMI